MTNGVETPRQKENDSVPPANSISEIITEMLHPFPLSRFRKDTFTTKFYMKSETYTVVLEVVEVISVHLSKRRFMGDLTQNYTNYIYKTETADTILGH